MAYTSLDDIYLTRLADRQFPPLPPEEPIGEEVVQLAAGPSRTMSDAGSGMPQIKPLPQTTLERALEQTGLTLEQAGRFLDGLGQVELPLLGKVSLADLVPFVGSAKEGSRSVMAPAEWQGTPKTLQQMGTGVGSMVDRVTTGTGMARQLNEDAKLAAMDVAFNAVPVAKVTAKAATKGANALAPKAGEMLEGYLSRTGQILNIVERTTENSPWILRDEFTAYQNQPRQLQGFKSIGPNKGFGEQKYKHAEFLEIKLDDGTTFYDAIRGLNKPHALSRAFGNWPAAAEIRPLTRLEAEKADPSLVKEVDAAMGASKEQK